MTLAFPLFFYTSYPATKILAIFVVRLDEWELSIGLLPTTHIFKIQYL